MPSNPLESSIRDGWAGGLSPTHRPRRQFQCDRTPCLFRCVLSVCAQPTLLQRDSRVRHAVLGVFCTYHGPCYVKSTRGSRPERGQIRADRGERRKKKCSPTFRCEVGRRTRSIYRNEWRRLRTYWTTKLPTVTMIEKTAHACCGGLSCCDVAGVFAVCVMKCW